MATLSGTGVLPATDVLTPLSLSFAAQPLNTASAAQQVTLTNSGDSALLLIAAQIASGDFTVVNSCGNSLNGHSTCTLLVAFAPKSVGQDAGVLTVSDQYRSQNIALNGVGVAPAGVSLSPLGTLQFPATGVGLSAMPQIVTLTNNGGVALSIQSITVSGDFAIATGSNTCGASLPVGAACAAQIVFAPTAAGARSGSLTVVDNAASSPQSLALTGTGVDFALSANGSTSVTVAAGTQAVYPLLLTSAAGVPGTVAFTCAGIPLGATCVVTPSSQGLGATSTISVAVATSVATMEFPGMRRVVWFVGALPLGLLALRRRRLRRAGAVAILCCGLVMGGCGVSRVAPQTSASTTVNLVTPTPAGMYNLTVSGTCAGLVRSVGLTLVVQ
jgi:hypothetical protein